MERELNKNEEQKISNYERLISTILAKKYGDKSEIEILLGYLQEKQINIDGIYHLIDHLILEIESELYINNLMVFSKENVLNSKDVREIYVVIGTIAYDLFFLKAEGREINPEDMINIAELFIKISREDFLLKFIDSIDFYNNRGCLKDKITEYMATKVVKREIREKIFSDFPINLN